MNQMEILNLMNQLNASNNPMGIINQICGSNPQMKQAVSMLNGGTDPQVLFENICRTKGLDINQTKQIFNQLGLRI